MTTLFLLNDRHILNEKKRSSETDQKRETEKGKLLPIQKRKRTREEVMRREREREEKSFFIFLLLEKGSEGKKLSDVSYFIGENKLISIFIFHEYTIPNEHTNNK